MSDRIPQGPPDTVAWPRTLSAHVAVRDDDGETRLHGYAVQGDLARHYGFAETVLLTLTGEAPSAQTGTAIGAALTIAAGLVHLGQAPVHAAALARVCAAPEAAIVATGSSGAAARAADMVRRHAALLAWLDDPQASPPGPAAGCQGDAAALARLDAALPTDWPRPWHAIELTLEQALLAVLFACGLRSPLQLVGALTIAQLPVIVAEAAHVEPGALSRWPTHDTPQFAYRPAGRGAAEQATEST